MQEQANLNPEERMKQAMENPEIQEILRDPAMRMILEQMQENPSAAREYVFILFFDAIDNPVVLGILHPSKAIDTLWSENWILKHSILFRSFLLRSLSDLKYFRYSGFFVYKRLIFAEPNFILDLFLLGDLPVIAKIKLHISYLIFPFLSLFF